eukprot:5674184-Amphidinium_carterae.2
MTTPFAGALLAMCAPGYIEFDKPCTSRDKSDHLCRHSEQEACTRREATISHVILEVKLCQLHNVVLLAYVNMVICEHMPDWRIHMMSLSALLAVANASNARHSRLTWRSAQQGSMKWSFSPS